MEESEHWVESRIIDFKRLMISVRYEDGTSPVIQKEFPGIIQGLLALHANFRKGKILLARVSIHELLSTPRNLNSIWIHPCLYKAFCDFCLEVAEDRTLRLSLNLWKTHVEERFKLLYR